MYSFFLGTEVEMERLGHMIHLGSDSRLFSRANVSFYILTHSVLNSQYLHILSDMHDHFSYFITDTSANDVVVHGPFLFICLIWLSCQPSYFRQVRLLEEIAYSTKKQPSDYGVQLKTP